MFACLDDVLLAGRVKKEPRAHAGSLLAEASAGGEGQIGGEGWAWWVGVVIGFGLKRVVDSHRRTGVVVSDDEDIGFSGTEDIVL